MGFDKLFSEDFRILEFSVNANMVYVIGIRDPHRGFFPFYVGKTGRLMGRMGDYDNANFDLSSLPDFHVGEAIKFFHSQKRRVEVKYKPSDNMTDEEDEWKKRIQQALGSDFRLLDESLFKPTEGIAEERQKIRRYCVSFLDVLENSRDTCAVRWQDALNGALAACDNAERLSNDAQLLVNNGSIQTGFAVSIIAWEEANKAGMLLKAYVEKTDISKTQWEKKYTNHPFKLQAYPMWVDVLNTGSKKPDKDKVVESNREIGKRYDLEKQLLGFYVDKNPDGSWSTPNKLSRNEEAYLKRMAPFYFYNTLLAIAGLRQRMEGLS